MNLEERVRLAWIAEASWRFWGRCTRCGEIRHVAGTRKDAVKCLECYDMRRKP